MQSKRYVLVYVQMFQFFSRIKISRRYPANYMGSNFLYIFHTDIPMSWFPPKVNWHWKVVTLFAMFLGYSHLWKNILIWPRFWLDLFFLFPVICLGIYVAIFVRNMEIWVSGFIWNVFLVYFSLSIYFLLFLPIPVFLCVCLFFISGWNMWKHYWIWHPFLFQWAEFCIFLWNVFARCRCVCVWFCVCSVFNKCNTSPYIFMVSPPSPHPHPFLWL